MTKIKIATPTITNKLKEELSLHDQLNEGITGRALQRRESAPVIRLTIDEVRRIVTCLEYLEILIEEENKE